MIHLVQKRGNCEKSEKLSLLSSSNILIYNKTLRSVKYCIGGTEGFVPKLE